MSNRYTQLFLLPQNLYSEGAPILIEAGALLNDSQTNKILAQLKYKNLQEKRIKAMNVRIQPMDVLGNPLGDAISFQYLDLSVDCDEVFGSQTPINLPDNTTRGFSVEVCSVVFDDNSVWEATDASWETLNKPIPFYTGKNQELLKQYQLLYGSGAIYQLQVMKDLWQCVCGSIHKNTTPTCHVCRNSLTDLRRFDMDALKEECAQRLDATAKADAIRRRKIRTLAIVMSSVITVTIAIALLWNPVIHPFVKYNKSYNEAISLFEAGEYKQAENIFLTMPDYKDSNSKVTECNKLITDGKYDNAVALMNAGKYTEAITAFEALNGYKDSATKIIECNTAILDGKYYDAIALMDAGKYTEAIAAFEALTNYKDSVRQIDACHTAILDNKYNNAIALMDAGKYDDAISAFEALEEYKDSTQKISECNTAILDVKYNAALTLMNSGKYENAITAFEEIKTHRDSAKHITTCMSTLAKNYVSKGNTTLAIKWYEKMGDKESANKVRYDYVLANKNNTNTTTYEYLKTLKSIGYKDSASLYATLYKMTGKGFFNESRDDISTSKTTIPSLDSSGYHDAYFHYNVMSSAPVAEIKVRIVYETRWGYDNTPREPYKIRSDSEYSVKQGEDKNYTIGLASNLYYHRVTLYDAETGEQIAQTTLYSPYLG